ncbi:PREDICTED: F-box/LRR-repeat protein At3g48880-like isoform X1 [Fragaria vesca subsp. vesca]|uniref:F-box/LRR-repeat protein At3g48880-like isoform X1 n=2 Tax=Fragaria vesca subsp. vesca TaxID=101020 RepID=UPI0002C36715|nr:PREDICTED: F-box/LRR-repeat protein At3g48880-like isoform X1 [Fragaria vesca subsp. vesca]
MTDKPSTRTRTDKHCDGVRLFGELRRSGEMEDSASPTRRWEDLDTDILVKIFQSFDVFELTSGIAHVCSGWRLACCDPLLWMTLDLSMMKSNFIKIPLEPYVYVDGRSDKLLTRLLKISMSLSRGNITTLIFHFNLYVSDDQLTYTAERSPKLKRLVLPAWNRIKKTGICKAISCWKELESLTMPSIANPPYFIDEIAKNCKNFKELKIMGPCDIFFASTLVAYLPNLKVLSLRCSMLLREALIMILEGLPHLEVLNISHCLLVDVTPPPVTKRVLREIDPFILEKASRLRRFLTCMQDTCVMCQRTKTDEGILRWYKYEEGLWQEDEVSSLAH